VPLPGPCAARAGRLTGWLLLVSDRTVTAQVLDRRAQEGARPCRLARDPGSGYRTLFETLPQGRHLLRHQRPDPRGQPGRLPDPRPWTRTKLITWPLAGSTQAVARGRVRVPGPASCRSRVALRTGEVVTDVVLGSPARPDRGKQRWLRVTAGAGRPRRGRPARSGAYAMFRDLTRERRACGGAA